MSGTQGSASFPNIAIPDGKKDESWHRQAVESITNRSLNNTYSINYISMNESVNYFNSLHTGDEYKFLQQSEDGEVLPAKWMNLNRIRPKLSIVMGEFMEKGYDINVKAINKEAISKRLEEKNRILVEMKLRPTAMALESQVGLPFQSAETLPEDEEDLDDFMAATYKETSEFIMEAALKWLAKRFEWDYTRYALFRDILIMGKCFAKVEIVNGLPVIRRIDPRFIIFDTNASDDLLTDSTFWGEVRYMNLADATEQYGLSEKEIEELQTSFKDSSQANLTISSTTNFITRDNQVLYFKQEAGELRILAVTAYWVDTKSYNHKSSKDNYGGDKLKRVKDTEVADEAKGEEIIKKRIKIWRKGTLLGGKIIKDWGEMENQPRDVDNLSETYPPYIGCIPFFMNGVGVSITHLLKPLQDLKDIVWYNVQKVMAQAGAKGIMFDVSQLPEGVEMDQAIKYLKNIGVGLIDTKKDGIPSNYNQFQSYDLTISDSIVRYIEIMQSVDLEMDAMSGINEARQGMVQGSSQAVGVTQSALFQSNLATAPLFKLFRIFASRCFNQQAKLVKIAWVGKEKFAPIIGDTGVDFLKQDVELDLNDYGVFVEEVPPMLDDINSFREFILAALQSGSLDFVEAMKLMMEKDIKVAVRRFERVMKKKEQEAMMQEQMMQQQQMEAQAELQAQQQQADAEAQMRDMQIEQLKGANALKQTFAKGKIDLAKEKIALFK